jgi:hypothetical protein
MILCFISHRSALSINKMQAARKERKLGILGNPMQRRRKSAKGDAWALSKAGKISATRFRVFGKFHTQNDSLIRRYSPARPADFAKIGSGDVTHY